MGTTMVPFSRCTHLRSYGYRHVDDNIFYARCENVNLSFDWIDFSLMCWNRGRAKRVPACNFSKVDWNCRNKIYLLMARLTVTRLNTQPQKTSSTKLFFLWFYRFDLFHWIQQFPPADNRKFVFDLRSFSDLFPDLNQMVLHVENNTHRTTCMRFEYSSCHPVFISQRTAPINIIIHFSCKIIRHH